MRRAFWCVLLLACHPFEAVVEAGDRSSLREADPVITIQCDGGSAVSESIVPDAGTLDVGELEDDGWKPDCGVPDGG